MFKVSVTRAIHSGGTKEYDFALIECPKLQKAIVIYRWSKVGLTGEAQVEEKPYSAASNSYRAKIKGKEARGYRAFWTDPGSIVNDAAGVETLLTETIAEHPSVYPVLANFLDTCVTKIGDPDGLATVLEDGLDELTRPAPRSERPMSELERREKERLAAAAREKDLADTNPNWGLF